jgi:bacterioferritin-associated ferredoxin
VYVCMCMAVTESTVRNCLRAGADSVERVGEDCGAGTGCGGCVETVRLIIEGGSLLHKNAPHRPDCELPRTA